MIPLRDHNHAQTRPIATYVLLAINLAVFAYQLTLDVAAERRVGLDYGFVPNAINQGDLSALSTVVTSMFMHGSILHCASNMWFLHIFGDNIEDALGSARFLAFYFASGIAGAFAQYLFDPSSTIPMIGASGAIAGVLGGYIRLFPHARIVTLIPIFVIMLVREIPAGFFLVIWFGLQLLDGVGALSSVTKGGGVAFFAHIGGFIAGAVLVSILGRRQGYRPHGGRDARPRAAVRRRDSF